MYIHRAWPIQYMDHMFFHAPYSEFCKWTWRLPDSSCMVGGTIMATLVMDWSAFQLSYDYIVACYHTPARCIHSFQTLLSDAGPAWPQCTYSSLVTFSCLWHSPLYIVAPASSLSSDLRSLAAPPMRWQGTLFIICRWRNLAEFKWHRTVMICNS